MMDAPASLSVHAVKATKLPASIVDVIERLPSFKFLPDDGRDIPPPLTLQDSSHLFEQIPAAINDGCLYHHPDAGFEIAARLRKRSHPADQVIIVGNAFQGGRSRSAVGRQV
ncbi:hypothetical protein HFN65_00055 [Rhizobium laguerreae]|uniref:hypothetical protein n=1 Tax=Rhizobium laguerreae TaxID=1076926 RepID=UPI001C9299C4|nr:hypothetical protein [Rhizobium laguerreae]MBY3496960.1 hypothetical protein [Rhizobium laguerreae]MBY3569422.1 hypothetical protein [Rhizobium laguerreae]